MLDPSHPSGFEPGHILVAPKTDPSWVPLFVPAGGELGVPCAGRRWPTPRWESRTGTITVDDDAGTVTIDAIPAG